MAEPYQLPGQFQVPSMAEISYAAGDQQAGANANWKMFTEQINAYTNINNANRLQSLREKEFARQIVENDRKFDLLSAEQDSLNRSRDIAFETSKYSLEQRKKQDDELADAWRKKPIFEEIIKRSLPLGGEDPNFERSLRPIFSEAKNQAELVVLNEVLNPYIRENKIYQAKDEFNKNVDLSYAIENGYLDVSEEELTDLERLRLQSPVLYRARLKKYLNEAKIAEDDAIRQREELRRATTLGQAEARAIEKGAEETEIVVDEKGNVSYKFKTPRPVAGRATTGGGEGAGAKSLTSMAKTFQEMGLESAERAKELKEAADGETDELKKKSLLIQSDAKLRESEEYNAQALEASRAARTGIPGAGASAPAVQSGLPVEAGARGILAPSLRDVKKTAPAGTTAPAPTTTPAPAPAPTPTTEAVPTLESTLSPAARSVLGVARVGGGIAKQAVKTAVSAVPAIGTAVSLAEMAPQIIEGAQTAGAVGRELSDYVSSINRAERAARARAAKGENFQSALVDEQRKIIEEITKAKTATPAVTSTF